MKTSSSLPRPILSGLFTIAAGLLAGRHAEAQVLGAEWSGAPSGYFGAAVQNAGDVDGDGVDDLLVGEPYYTAPGFTYEGRVSLFSGGSHALIRSHDGTQAFEFLGYAICGAGDMNLDGRADYAIGSQHHASNGFTENGAVVVYSGIDGSVLWSIDGVATNSYLGASVAGIADADGDGKPDLLVNGYGTDVVTVYGAAGSVIYSVTGQGSSSFGFSLSACGDLDGDGVRDFVVGAPYYTGGSPSVNFRGAAIAYSAATGNLLFQVLGDSLNDNLGRTVSSLGDVDGDGIPDLLAGSWNSFGNGSLSGMIRVASGADGATIRTVYGDGVNDRLGWAIVGMGDMDGDGVDDYAASTLDGPAPYYMGRVRAYSGSSGVVIYEWLGESTPTTSDGDFGSGLAAGDFDHDGGADLVIGDQGYYVMDPITGQWSGVGLARVYYGCPASASNYGAGWPGRYGIPGIVALDKPVPGQPISIQIDNSLGASTVALLLLGLDSANLPTSKGGTILVDALFTILFPIAADGETLGDTLPDDPALYDLDVYLQALEADAYASKKLSFTPGLKLHCGFDLP